MISICIPVYNYDVSDLLNQLIEQCNDLPEFTEILIYDDASTKQTVLNTQHEMITVHLGKENIGSVASRKHLANFASNDWILFLDTDLELPSSDFLASYLNSINDSSTLYYGGVCYKEQTPEANKILRWKYGHKRESRKPQSLEEVYNYFVSCSFLIDKTTFDSIFTSEKMPGYGQDIYITSLLKKLDIEISFIKNPVIHLGLESNEVYYKKSMEGIETTFHAEINGLIPDNCRPVQRAYLKMKKIGVTRLFIKLIEKRKLQLEKNLVSGKPKLIYLDLLKLYYYSSLKQTD